MAGASVPYSNGLGTTWGLKATGVAPSSRWTGRGIRIAMLDTGVDRRHPDLAPRLAAAASFVAGGAADDEIGHGTHCAGTTVGRADPGGYRYGIAREAELYAARVFDDCGRSDVATVVAAIEWAVSRGCHVIGLPLGSHEAAASAFEDVAARALDVGCLVIAAAGNRARASAMQPAGARSILAVGAVDNWLRPAAFSSGTVGSGAGGVDLVAPGVSVYSTAPGSRYDTRDGTSAATAHAVGIAALWAEAEGLRGRALWQRLVSASQPLAASGAAPLRLVAAPAR